MVWQVLVVEIDEHFRISLKEIIPDGGVQRRDVCVDSLGAELGKGRRTAGTRRRRRRAAGILTITKNLNQSNSSF